MHRGEARGARRHEPSSPTTKLGAVPSSFAKHPECTSQPNARLDWHTASPSSQEERIRLGPNLEKPVIVDAFAEGSRRRQGTTFGTVNADVLEHRVPGYRHVDFIEVIEGSSWPE